MIKVAVQKNVTCRLDFPSSHLVWEEVKMTCKNLSRVVELLLVASFSLDLFFLLVGTSSS